MPHTHWDREWYLPFEHFQLRLGHVVDGVVDVLERDRDFTSFTLDGQAIVLEDYLAVRPENESRLRSLISAGRIEIGPSYVLPDEFLVGAEPLVRNLLIGREVCRRFGAEPSSVGYMPDSFGHPVQLPQILAGFGIETFVFSRGLGDEIDDLGAVFRWCAPDGSEVLAFQQLDHYGNFAVVWKVEDAEERVRSILERFGELLERAGIDEFLLCNGTDHVPIKRDLPQLCSALQERFPGSSFTIATYAEYVRAVGPVQVPRFAGELLGARLQNILRGVNSSRMYVKQANEEAERRLLAVETLGALRTLHDGASFPVSDFNLVWRQLLRCHPHDTICGCSCDEVHRDAMARYESLNRSLSVLQERALAGLVSEDPAPGTVGVVNLLPFRRRGVVELPGAEPAIVELDGFTAGTVEVHAQPSADATAGERAIESDRFRVEATADGTLTLVDKQRDRRWEGLHRFEDEPDMGDLYNFCPIRDAAIWRSDSAQVRLLRRGPAVSELELRIQAKRPMGLGEDFRPLPELGPLDISTVVRLIEGSERVEFRTTVKNATRDHRLRVCFPVAGAQGPVRAETAFALVGRPAVPPPPRGDWVEPPDPTQHTLGAVAWGSLALMTKGLPEYEAGAIGESPGLRLTLLRCVGVISQPDDAPLTRPHTAGPQMSTPDAQCLGRHQFEYALLANGGELDDVALLRAAQDYRHGFLSTASPIALHAELALEGDVVFSCLKGAEDGDGLILRAFNPTDSAAAARVGGAVSVSRTRLDETEEEALPVGTFQVVPGQIATLRVRRATRDHA